MDQWLQKSKLPGGALKKQKVAAPPLPLSEEQQAVVASIRRGESTFFTGSAGTGKSFTLRAIIKALNEEHRGRGVYVTASTGAAATQVGGTTVNAFAGVGLGTDDAATLARKVGANRYAAKRWKDCRALVIDEISMIDAGMFDKLEHVARSVRGSDEAFGGVQLIVCGDFLQLPPVMKGQSSSDKYFFAFEAEAWGRCFQRQVALTKVFRQKDGNFVGLLNEMRVAKLSPASISTLKGLAKTDLSRFAPVEPTRLSCYNADVDKVNAQRLASLKSLPGEAFEISANDSGAEPHLSALQRNSNFPAALALKVGAQVMLLANTDIEQGLVNGARGVVEAFLNFQTPPGRAALLGTEKDIEFILVKFASGTSHKIGREVSKVEEGSTTKASRTQFPLRLAWCISIHKAQGQTLDLLEVDLKGCFEAGQAYTAVSRATDLKRLRVVGFDEKAVRAHPRVVSYMASLTSHTQQTRAPAKPVFAPASVDGGWISKSQAPAFNATSVAFNSTSVPSEASRAPAKAKKRYFVVVMSESLSASAILACEKLIADHDGATTTALAGAAALVCGEVLKDGSPVEYSQLYQQARSQGLTVVGLAQLPDLLIRRR